MTLKIPTITGIITVTLLFLFGGMSPATQAGSLQVSFFDVGQGDSIFIESPDGTQVLIDGGKGDAVLHELGRRMGFSDRTIDMVVATHPDLDHTGGLLKVFEQYEVRTVLMTENVADTPHYEALIESLEAEGADVRYARAGQVFDLGLGAEGTTTLSVLFPDRDPTNWESNTSSIIVKLSYGRTDFLLTGDAPDEIEEELVRLFGSTLQSEVLKAGHHGSRTSTSEAFLETVAPEYVVISAGRDNSYGHPHKEVVDRIMKKNIRMESTQEGTIHFVSDGKTVMVE